MTSTIPPTDTERECQPPAIASSSTTGSHGRPTSGWTNPHLAQPQTKEAPVVTASDITRRRLRDVADVVVPLTVFAIALALLAVVIAMVAAQRDTSQPAPAAGPAAASSSSASSMPTLPEASTTKHDAIA